MVSLHAEVSGDGNIYELHDLIDRIERELKEKLHCETVIHMDPIDVGNVKTVEMKEEMVKLVKAIDERLTIHDFRMVTGTTHHNICLLYTSMACITIRSKRRRRMCLTGSSRRCLKKDTCYLIKNVIRYPC